MRSYFAKRNRRLKTAHPRRGFILVMVLVLITLAGLSLAGLARRSLELAGEAATATVPQGHSAIAAGGANDRGVLACIR